MCSPLYWSFLVGGVNTATLKDTGGQTPPLMCKLVSLDSAQCAITSDFCGFLLSAVTELVLLFAGLWIVFCGVPSEKGVTSAALLTWMGDMSSAGSSSRVWKGTERNECHKEWLEASPGPRCPGCQVVLQGWIVAQGNAGRTPGKIPQIPLDTGGVTLLWEWPGALKNCSYSSVSYSCWSRQMQA